ncbi:hypothetical protein LTR10_024007 [Elasticomyces elasticus]|uniref:Piwi domain-containing protein n=1 Tax=Exophiala sideris TaxID=1016849 RepID=A0ABR0J673_9EURO|nr:hypothetical protein LTR10_024007 [Elasticomyces elasticus]KAK5028800.1 hypothetical protein LTS07_006179 [Exophiala sideris]KAK5035669.1 hypothetical protein LTR13_005798 [Exophiala sideris]KAK5057304.1 hypothetical protein LTR69_007343 [Exophiala sideris]KAK5181723.1 hypothetical protein LTR44_005923 [Eurotiomycetes sp. CCFEE 6388]
MASRVSGAGGGKSSSSNPGRPSQTPTLPKLTEKLSLNPVHKLHANHFEVTVGKYKKLYRYNLTFQKQYDPTTPNDESNKTKTASAADNDNNHPGSQQPSSRGIQRDKKKRIVALLMTELKTDKEVAKIPMATDYSEHIITAEFIQKDESRDVTIDYYDEYRPGPPVTPEVYIVTITFVNELSLSALDAYLSGDPSLNNPTPVQQADKDDAVSAMNIVFSYRPYQRCFPRFSRHNPPQFFERSLTTMNGRIFYGVNDTSGSTETGDLIEQGLLDSIPGFTRSVRTVFSSQVKINLNINTKTSLFYRPDNVQQLINMWKVENVRNQWLPHHREELVKFLKGVSVRTRHFRGNTQYDNFLAKITDIPYVAANQEPTVSRVPLEMPRMPSTGTVANYFDANYGTNYSPNSSVTTVFLGTGAFRSTFPADLLTIIPGQLMRKTKELPKGGVRDPMTNKEQILTCGRSLFHGSTAAEGGAPEFDLGLGAEMLSVPVHLLDPPTLYYRSDAVAGAAQKPRPEKAVKVQQTRYGSWNLYQMSYFKPAQPFRWTLVELTLPGQFQPQCSDDDFEKFRNDLGKEMRRLRLSERWVPLDVHKQALPSANLPTHRDVQGPHGLIAQFVQVREFLAKVKNKVDLVVVLLPEKDMELYSTVKRIGDQGLGLATVCHVLKTNARKTRVWPLTSPQFFANLSMKINLKADNTAVNQALANKPGMLAEGTMILGIDVTHAGATALKWAPSVAAVVGSVDAQFSQWPASLAENRVVDVEGAEGKKKANEQVVDLQKMVVERLYSYHMVNKKLPKRLVVYRDGLSEGQFEMCQNFELPRIRAAIDDAFNKSKQDRGTGMEIILICAVKRHHTRLFAETDSEQQTDKLIGPDGKEKKFNFNPLPGTLVKDVITYGRGKDFFLISQKAQIGTARPTHYVILHNDTPFSRDEIAKATHHLCFLFGRATGTVSVCPAAYYADLAADRARCYVRKFYVPAASGIWDPANNTNHKLGLEIHPNMREKMFYI